MHLFFYMAFMFFCTSIYVVTITICFSRPLSPGLEDLLLRMLIKDPNNRITISDMKVFTTF